MQPGNDETILFFLTDYFLFREYVKAKEWAELKNVSDLLVFCKRLALKIVLLFVELKGAESITPRNSCARPSRRSGPGRMPRCGRKPITGP